jgi:hypothetical protein
MLRGAYLSCAPLSYTLTFLEHHAKMKSLGKEKHSSLLTQNIIAEEKVLWH